MECSKFRTSEVMFEMSKLSQCIRFLVVYIGYETSNRREGRETLSYSHYSLCNVPSVHGFILYVCLSTHIHVFYLSLEYFTHSVVLLPNVAMSWCVCLGYIRACHFPYGLCVWVCICSHTHSFPATNATATTYIDRLKSMLHGMP